MRILGFCIGCVVGLVGTLAAILIPAYMKHGRTFVVHNG